MKRALNRLFVAIALAIVSGNAVAEERETPPPGMGKYVVVLWHAGTPEPGNPEKRMKDVPEPDIAKAGGRVLARVANRRVVYLPFAAVKQLQRHEAVAYVQRIWLGESLADWDERAPSAASTSPKIATDSDTNLEWGPKTFSYDGSGNITQVGSDEYTYDSAGRLIKAKVNGKTQKFKYDPFGNLVRQEVEGAAAIDIDVDPASNRLRGPEYDAAGNVTTRDGHARYVYDSLNMLTHYEGASDRRILYDGDDERIGTIIDSLSRWTIRDLEGQILREYRGEDLGLSMLWYWEQDHIRAEGMLLGGETQEWRYQGSESLQVFGGERHYHLDHLGSVRMVTNKLGRSISQHDFFPFGVTQTKTYQEPVNWADPHVDAMRFAGHWRDFLGYTDVEGNDYLDYMHARYYDPNLGRFLSVDPVLGTPSRPQSWNRYSYVQNNPIGAIDPTGMKMECVAKDDGTEDCTVVPDEPLPDDPVWDTFRHGNSEIGLLTIRTPYLDERLGGASFSRGWNTGWDTVWQRFGEFNAPEDSASVAMTVISFLPFGKLPKLARALRVGKAFNPQQRAVIELAKEAQRRGVSRDEAMTLIRWAREHGIHYQNHIGTNHWIGGPHIRIGPINHIRVH